VPRTSIKGGVLADEGNHFQPQLHGLELSSELLAWNYLGGYGYGWMLMGCKSPLQRITSYLFFVFDEHIHDQGLKNLTSKLLPHRFSEDGITLEAKIGVGGISNLFDDGKNVQCKYCDKIFQYKSDRAFNHFGYNAKSTKPFAPKCPPP
jgi:hypothetical protein